MSRTKSLSVVALMVGLFILLLVADLGYPVIALCLSSDPELAKWKGISSSGNCFGTSEMEGPLSLKSHVWLLTLVGVLVSGICIFTAWAVAKQRDHARKFWLASTVAASAYFLLFEPLPGLTLNLAFTLAFFVVLAISYFFLPHPINANKPLDARRSDSADR
jgi:heme/copper-type cytochrome/quinol oxidase subunit 3